MVEEIIFITIFYSRNTILKKREDNILCSFFSICLLKIPSLSNIFNFVSKFFQSRFGLSEGGFSFTESKPSKVGRKLTSLWSIKSARRDGSNASLDSQPPFAIVQKSLKTKQNVANQINERMKE